MRRAGPPARPPLDPAESGRVGSRIRDRSRSGHGETSRRPGALRPGRFGRGPAPAARFLDDLTLKLGHTLGGRIDGADPAPAPAAAATCRWEHALDARRGLRARDGRAARGERTRGPDRRVRSAPAHGRRDGCSDLARPHHRMVPLAGAGAESRGGAAGRAGRCSPSSPSGSTCACCCGRAHRSRRSGPPAATSVRWSRRSRATRRSRRALDARTGLVPLPPREDDRDRRPGRVRRRHRPHDRRRRSVRHAEPPGPRWDRLARRRRPHRRAGRPGRGRALPAALAERSGRDRSRLPPSPSLPATWSSRSCGRCRAGAYRAVANGDYSILESYIGALRSAEQHRLPREPVPLVARDRRRSSPTSSSTRRPTTSGSSCSCRRARTTVPTSRAVRSRR